MTSMSNRVPGLGGYGSGYGRALDGLAYRAQDRENYLHPNRYTNQGRTGAGQSKTGYKYTFYKDPTDYHYHSKDRDSLAPDSVRQNEPREPYKPREPSMTYSPSFRRPQQKSREFLDSIDNIIESHRSKYSQSSQQPNLNGPQGQTESQQILFLKQKLIETHHKLLKQLQQTNKLAFELQTMQAQIEVQQKQNSNLKMQIERMRRQIDILHDELNAKGEKNEEKYRSMENKLGEEGRRNGQLKEDLQAMRNKMLETLMVKNNYQEENMNYKSDLGRLEKVLDKVKSELNEKEQNLEYVTKQLELLRKKYDKCEKECEERAEQIHQYSHLAAQRQKSLHTLQNELKSQKQRNSTSISEFINLQAQHKAALKRLAELQDQCQKYKGQIYWHQKNNENNQKAMKEKMEKMTEEYNFLNIKFKEREREIENLRRKPVYEKKKNYEQTREFVNRLESQQMQIGQSRVAGARTQSKGSGKGSASKSPKNQPTTRNTRSPYPKPQNPITHEPLTNRPQPSTYPQQKSKYISMLSQVGDLQSDLLNYNMEKKRILNEMDKIDDTKIKTKDMIVRRRKLQDQAHTQDVKIRRVKEELRKMKAL